MVDSRDRLSLRVLGQHDGFINAQRDVLNSEALISWCRSQGAGYSGSRARVAQFKRTIVTPIRNETQGAASTRGVSKYGGSTAGQVQSHYDLSNEFFRLWQDPNQ